RRRGGAMAQAGAAGRQPHLARDRAGDAAVEQPARHGVHQVRLRTARPVGKLRDDFGEHDDDCAPRLHARVGHGVGCTMKYFEDIAVGERASFGSYTFTSAEIKSFAARFDPQPFHLDEAAAAQSPYGALMASGWHTIAVWMRHAMRYRRAEDEA